MIQFIKALGLLIFILGTNTQLYSRILDMLERGRYVSLIIFMAIWGISVLGLSIVFFNKNKSIRILFGLLISISTFCGMSYYSIGGHALNYMDMELLWISRAHSMKALDYYFPHLIQPFFWGVFGFIIALMPVNLPQRLARFIKNFIFLVPLPYLVLMAITYKKAGYGTVGMPNQYSAVSTFILLHAYDSVSRGMIESRDAPYFKPENKPLAKNIIFIMDESIRGDYLSYDPKTGTVPSLWENRELFVDFGKMSSSNNCSGYSNAVFRMGGIRGKLEKIGSNPFIWQYAKQAGFKTWYLDAQLKRGELQNFMTEEERSYIDHFVQLDKTEEPDLDYTFASKIKRITEAGGKNFVFINKRGAHFPYAESYRVIGEPRYKPLMKKNEKPEKESMINSYKMAIYWNTNRFFEKLLENTLKDSFIFYTSDHGQNLFDKGIQTHCNTEEPAFSEGLVPFLIFPNEENFDLVQEWKKVNHDKGTHFQLFPTVLFSLGYEKGMIEKNYGPLLDKSASFPQEFSAGPVLSKFGKEVDWNSINP
jgi:glucan phosphoethanolaminetransferase (alkaline phosphatase superfamily)